MRGMESPARFRPCRARTVFGRYTRPFRPGYNISGFQPDGRIPAGLCESKNSLPRDSVRPKLRGQLNIYGQTGNMDGG